MHFPERAYTHRKAITKENRGFLLVDKPGEDAVSVFIAAAFIMKFQQTPKTACCHSALAQVLERMPDIEMPPKLQTMLETYESDLKCDKPAEIGRLQ